MGLRNTTTDWGSLAKSLHWLIAAGVFVLIYLGLEQAGMERGDERSRIRFIHASIATAVLVLMTIRIVWRFMNDVPAHPEGNSKIQRIISDVVHWGLYLTIFGQLMAGALVVGTGGKGLPFFGLFTIPLGMSENHDAHEFWEEVHEFMWKPVAALIVLHILGSVYNHFIKKNDVLRRMTHGVK